MLPVVQKVNCFADAQPTISIFNALGLEDSGSHTLMTMNLFILSLFCNFFGHSHVLLSFGPVFFVIRFYFGLSFFVTFLTCFRKMQKWLAKWQKDDKPTTKKRQTHVKEMTKRSHTHTNASPTFAKWQKHDEQMTHLIFDDFQSLAPAKPSNSGVNKISKDFFAVCTWTGSRSISRSHLGPLLCWSLCSSFSIKWWHTSL